MPPLGHWYQGIEAVTSFAGAVPFGTCGAWRHVLTCANNQPAAASYLRIDGDDTYRAWAINILTVRDGLVAAVTSFIGTEHFQTSECG